MADNLIQAFSCIQPAHERLDALTKLLHYLDPDERAHLRITLSQQCDPLSVLPVEIVLQIFDHLPIFYVWTLRSVCKQWNQVLSSDDLLRNVMLQWHSQDDHDSARPTGSKLIDSIDNRVQHVRALATGQPLEESFVTDTGTGVQGPMPQLSLPRFYFKGKHMAYISSRPGQGDAVTVCDLTSHSLRTFRGEARERIMTVILTTRLVAFVTFDGCLYVARLHNAGNECTRFQLPSARVRAMGADGATVVLAMNNSTHERTYVNEMILYDDNTKRLRSLDVRDTLHDLERANHPLNLKLNSSTFIIDSGRRIADFFTLLALHSSHSIDKELAIRHVRFSFDGECLGSSMWTNSINPHTSIRHQHFAMAPPHPNGYAQQFRLAACELPLMGGLPYRLKFAVLFDSARGEFLADASGHAAVAADVAFWIRQIKLLWKGKLHRPPVADDWVQYVAYMNDSFMVSLEISKHLTQSTRIRVLCFDPSILRAKAIET